MIFQSPSTRNNHTYEMLAVPISYLIISECICIERCYQCSVPKHNEMRFAKEPFSSFKKKDKRHEKITSRLLCCLLSLGSKQNQCHVPLQYCLEHSAVQDQLSVYANPLPCFLALPQWRGDALVLHEQYS